MVAISAMAGDLVLDGKHCSVSNPLDPGLIEDLPRLGCTYHALEGMGYSRYRGMAHPDHRMLHFWVSYATRNKNQSCQR